MKPISLTKTMPWLLGASAVFTLAFSQNVSANTNGNQQATSIKQVQETNTNQANTNNLNLRMLYLNTSAKATLLNPGAKSPTNDGLGDAIPNHNNVNAYLADSGGAMSSEDEFFDYNIPYSIGNPKFFNDPSLKPNKTQALSDSNYARFSRNHWKTAEEAKNDVGYSPAEDFQNNPQIDLSNGIKAYKEVHYEAYNRPQKVYSLIFYQGNYQIKIYGVTASRDQKQIDQLWNKLISQGQQTVFSLKQTNLPQTDNHGVMEVRVPDDPIYIYPDLTTNIFWQEGNQVYTSNVSNPSPTIDPISTNLKMVESVK